MDVWKPIVGYEGLYEVSDSGQVRSLSKLCGRSKRDEKELKTFVNSFGYVKVNLFRNSCGKQFSVHRLVAEAFIPNPDNLPQVNHKDGNKQNNTVENLEWCSVSENINHAIQVLNRKSRNQPVTLVKNGTQIYFDSKKEASLFLNCHGKYLQRKFRKTHEVREKGWVAYDFIL